MKTKNEWFQHIENLHHNRIALGLDRVASVGARLEVTHFSCPVVTVAGTNGKGSCVKTLEKIYSLAGYKVGLYTSPHLIDFNERININEQPIDDESLLIAFQQVEEKREGVILSFFEYTTLAALHLFKKAQCDVVILEIGLGGRLDAVNIVENDIAILTSVAFDHMDYLGNTLEAIGYEKASIARSHKPFICAEPTPPASVFATVSAMQGHFYQINRDFCYPNDFPNPRLKKENVAAALFAVRCLESRLPVSSNVCKEAVLNTVWPGRFECNVYEINGAPFECVLDVAHNPQASAWLACQYASLPKQKTVGIVGMLADKALIETISPLLTMIEAWCVCDLSQEAERGSDGKILFDFLRSQNKVVRLCASVSEAISYAAQQNTVYAHRTLIFGSFYTIANAYKIFQNLKVL